MEISKRVEKFISDYTRSCSNVVAYSGMIEGSELRYHEWLTPDQARSVAEIAREETIAEVCEWIDAKYVHYLDVSAKGTLTANIRQFITDLKQAMKNE